MAKNKPMNYYLNRGLEMGKSKFKFRVEDTDKKGEPCCSRGKQKTRPTILITSPKL